MKRVITLLAILIGLLGPFNAWSQSWMDEIQLVVPRHWDQTLDNVAPTIAETLSAITQRDVNIFYPKEEGLAAALTSHAFREVDGSQLALVSLDPGQSGEYLTEMSSPIALFGRNDLALFVLSDSDIRNLQDFNTENLSAVGVHSPASRWAAIETFKELGIPSQRIDSQSLDQSIHQLLHGQVEAFVGSVLLDRLARSKIRQVAVLSDENLSWTDVTGGQGIMVGAAYDYMLVGPRSLDQSAYHSLNQAMKSMVNDRSFQEALGESGLRLEHIDGAQYFSALQRYNAAIEDRTGDNFCKTCDCSDKDCKLNCPKC